MLAKSIKEKGYIMMVLAGLASRANSDGETASAKRTQRTMQAARGVAFPLKLIQPRKGLDADGDAVNVAEASTERAQLVSPGRSVGVAKTVACIEGSELELGRPDCFLARGSRTPTKGRDQP